MGECSNILCKLSIYFLTKIGNTDSFVLWRSLELFKYEYTGDIRKAKHNNAEFRSKSVSIAVWVDTGWLHHPLVIILTDLQS